jgi:ribosomal protein S27E
MPRYRYVCADCCNEQMAFHRINETADSLQCKFCELTGSLVKALTTPQIIKTDELPTSKKVGEITKEYIKANKELLKEEKNKAKEETYEPT